MGHRLSQEQRLFSLRGGMLGTVLDHNDMPMGLGCAECFEVELGKTGFYEVLGEGDIKVFGEGVLTGTIGWD